MAVMYCTMNSCGGLSAPTSDREQRTGAIDAEILQYSVSIAHTVGSW
jgi:hypothetical protein